MLSYWKHNWELNCLFISSFMLTAKGTSEFHITSPMRVTTDGCLWSPAQSTNNAEMFPCLDIIIVCNTLEHYQWTLHVNSTFYYAKLRGNHGPVAIKIAMHLLESFVLNSFKIFPMALRCVSGFNELSFLILKNCEMCVKVDIFKHCDRGEGG